MDTQKNKESFYNKEQYPVFMFNNGNWDIYSNGQSTAAIPTPEGLARGCKPSHFGSIRYAMQHAKKLKLEIEAEDQHREAFQD